jgi:hypothetical protein
MENDNKLKQPKAQETAPQTDVWTSGFDSKTTPKASPPPMQLSSDPIKGPQETEEGEYDPETIVFDIGGFADPQNPGGDNGKGIKVTIPPDLDGPTALVQVVMQMLRLTETEAIQVIVKEELQWIDYKVNGHGLDRMGNAVHLLRFKPTFVERVAHEPVSQKPQDAKTIALYNGFKIYLEDHADDHIRDPETQYDRWAVERGFFVESVPQTVGGATIPGTFANTDFHEREGYESDRKAVVELVTWERLRAKRETLAVDIPQERSEMKFVIQTMADQFRSVSQIDLIKNYVNASLYNQWAAIHGTMIVAQGQLENGDTAIFEGNNLARQLSEMIRGLSAEASGQIGKSIQWRWNKAHVAELEQLSQVQGLTLEQGRRVLYLYYKCIFAMMEVLGNAAVYATEDRPFTNVTEEKDVNKAGKHLAMRGEQGQAFLDVLNDHPSAKRIHATFYIEQDVADFRQEGEANGGADLTKGREMQLFLWHEADTNEWVLKDLTDFESPKHFKQVGDVNQPVPAALFAQMNSSDFLPKGALFYRIPEEGSYRIMRTTEPMELKNLLNYVGMTGMAIGMAAATMGASIPATVAMIFGATAMGTSELLKMIDLGKHGQLTTEAATMHTAMMLSCFGGAATGTLGLTSEFLATFSQGGANVVRVVTKGALGFQTAADTVCIAVFTKDAFTSLGQAAKDPDGLTFERLMGFFLQMGMNGVMLYGVGRQLRGSAKDGLAFGATETALVEESGAKTLRYRPKSKAVNTRRNQSPRKAPIKDASIVPDNIQVHPAYKSLNKAKRAELEQTFASDADFKTAIMEEPSLIRAWASVKELTVLKRDSDFLKALQHVLDNKEMQKHLFEGDFYIPSSGYNAGTKKATGMHSEYGIRSGKVRIMEGSEVRHCRSNPEVYEAKVERRDETNGNWIPKSRANRFTTFFPGSWTKSRTLEEVAFAYKEVLFDKAAAKISGNEYATMSFDGTIEIHMYLGTSDDINSAFPSIIE